MSNPSLMCDRDVRDALRSIKLSLSLLHGCKATDIDDLNEAWTVDHTAELKLVDMLAEHLGVSSNDIAHGQETTGGAR